MGKTVRRKAKIMQSFGIEQNLAVLQDGLIETWSREASQYYEKPGTPAATLHKMSQSVTTILTLLELADMGGEVLPEDLPVLLQSARELRENILQLRANNNRNTI